jgi:uncharacterized protein
MTAPEYLRETHEGTIVEVVVQPRASKNELARTQEGNLKLWLTAPPVEGEANKECLKFLAKLLGISKSNLEIVQGQKSRRKRVLVRGVSPELLQTTLKQVGII